ncbi:hypothetical protein [Asticcacaulis sp. AC402]|uniref:hypothetical protein n=1 Tax=Asticcacaulis sp. AC402 TaxID=1282361 RepID=UPI0003C3F74D|nr:hypothetical protein [Asticcacaulis sp. AC402]ESQ77734.1 hypothetical protein ABAC402_00970 [Asticcacaulis sp. AC402]
MHVHIAPYPTRQQPAPIGQPSLDGEIYDDDLPPELFDEDEDREDLVTYIHIAEHVED